VRRNDRESRDFEALGELFFSRSPRSERDDDADASVPDAEAAPPEASDEGMQPLVVAAVGAASTEDDERALAVALTAHGLGVCGDVRHVPWDELVRGQWPEPTESTTAVVEVPPRDDPFTRAVALATSHLVVWCDGSERGIRRANEYVCALADARRGAHVGWLSAADGDGGPRSPLHAEDALHLHPLGRWRPGRQVPDAIAGFVALRGGPRFPLREAMNLARLGGHGRA
jgi:hypothetical protein